VLKALASRFAHRRADALHEQGVKRRDAGDDEGALALYHRALELEPARANTLYNIGLIHKYRGAWRESLEFNKRAFELRPGDEATFWNLGIAATALGDWTTARFAWAAAGIKIPDGEGPIEADFGRACVRLDPDGEAEIVWVGRVDPVRARIQNVPFLGGGYFYGDLMLHDGAPMGVKVWNEREYSIFNAFERVARSEYSTAVLALESPSEADVAQLEAAGDADGLVVEDWTSGTYFVCKACSEGVTHVEHEQIPAWNPNREVGVAVRDEDALHRVLSGWADGGPGRAVEIVELVR
jgi:tetratricopeptide (TPR) repeat protein